METWDIFYVKVKFLESTSDLTLDALKVFIRAFSAVEERKFYHKNENIVSENETINVKFHVKFYYFKKCFGRW